VRHPAGAGAPPPDFILDGEVAHLDADDPFLPRALDEARDRGGRQIETPGDLHLRHIADVMHLRDRVEQSSGCKHLVLSHGIPLAIAF
jgi:hypothetical protein